ncbi:hypothetical protein BON30_37995 [Cystobacter ferrugineus]|uniref:Uncharacterized protein n=1 Tax=Cystobacter ferrugineus TaxID=83449 RepID=A0A1L9AZB5_9BACT|nr:hypothetical protein BON30_37995 [Cystobacter ferrugineus]
MGHTVALLPPSRQVTLQLPVPWQSTRQEPVQVTLQLPTRSQLTSLAGPTVNAQLDASEQRCRQFAPHWDSQELTRAQARSQSVSQVVVQLLPPVQRC